MESQKIIDESDTAVAYVLCKSVVDHKALKMDEFTNIVEHALKGRTSTRAIEDYMQSVEVLWESLKRA
jgi:hypothetical protein